MSKDKEKYLVLDLPVRQQKQQYDSSKLKNIVGLSAGIKTEAVFNLESIACSIEVSPEQQERAEDVVLMAAERIAKRVLSGKWKRPKPVKKWYTKHRERKDIYHPLNKKQGMEIKKKLSEMLVKGELPPVQLLETIVISRSRSVRSLAKVTTVGNMRSRKRISVFAPKTIFVEADKFHKLPVGNRRKKYKEKANK